MPSLFRFPFSLVPVGLGGKIRQVVHEQDTGEHGNIRCIIVSQTVRPRDRDIVAAVHEHVMQIHIQDITLACLSLQSGSFGLLFIHSFLHRLIHTNAVELVVCVGIGSNLDRIGVCLEVRKADSRRIVARLRGMILDGHWLIHTVIHALAQCTVFIITLEKTGADVAALGVRGAVDVDAGTVEGEVERSGYVVFSL